MRVEPVVVVTDSTCYLPADLIAAHELVVVPLHVVLDGRSHTEGVDISTSEVAQALVEHREVTTSGATPAAFAEAYRKAGVKRVVSVHISSRVSGTVDAARVAAAEVAEDGIEVRVLDSRCLGMALGFVAVTTATAAAGGDSLDVVISRATARARTCRTWLYVDTLEYLRRGGRISATAAALGSALSVKPLLHVVEGRVEPLEKVRTAGRALARLEELVLAQAGQTPVDVAVQHLAAPSRAEELAERLRQRLPGIGRLVVAEVGAVIGAHVGPGMVGVALAPSQDYSRS